MDKNDIITVLVFVFLIGAGLGYYLTKIFFDAAG